MFWSVGALGNKTVCLTCYEKNHYFSPGFTPLILAATAGHVGVVEILLDNGADIEAQSERTKDTPLSLACSGGRQEVTCPFLWVFSSTQQI